MLWNLFGYSWSLFPLCNLEGHVMQNAEGSVWRLTLSTVLKASEHWKQLHTVNQQILAAIKFGVSQTKNDLAAIQFGMSPSSFLLILTFPHLLGQIYLWQTTTRQPTRRPYFYLSMNILGYKCYFAFTTKSYSLQSILLGWIKWVGPILTHLYPHMIPEEDKSVCNHQTETQPFVLCGLMSDLVICKF